MRPIPRRKFVFDKDKMLGVYGISTVLDPANGFEAIQLSNQENTHDCKFSSDDIPSELIDEILSKGEKVDLNDWELIDEKSVDNDSVYNIDLATIPDVTGEDGSEDNEIFRIRYEYTPNSTSANSREFCVKMAKSGLTFRKEDLINSKANPGFGPFGSESYNIFLYKGGVNCQHSFTRKIYLRKNNKKLSTYDALKYISGLDKESLKKAKIPQTPPEVTQVASQSNNYWKLSKEISSSDIVNIKCSNEEKKILIAPVLVPEQNIYRNLNGEEFYGYFDEETIYDLLLNYQKNQYNKNTTIDHKEVVEGVFTFQNWIVENPKNDKANELGFDVPKGTWMCAMSVSDEVWNDYVKTGKVKGFSIDSILAIATPDIQTPQKNNFQKMNHTEVKELVMKILMEQARAEFKISDDLTLFADKLEKDMVVYDKDQVPYSNQKFTYEGKDYTTDETGKITEISEVKKEDTPATDVPLADTPAETTTPAEATPNVEELQTKLDEALLKIQDLEAENSSLKAELTATKEEVLNLSKQAPEMSINLSDTAIFTTPTNAKRTNQEVIADFFGKEQIKK